MEIKDTKTIDTEYSFKNHMGKGVQRLPGGWGEVIWVLNDEQESGKKVVNHTYS